MAGFEPTCLKEINEIHDALDRSANLQASDQAWYSKSSNLENLRRRVQQMGIIMFLKNQYFLKLRALKDDVTVNQKYYFLFQKFKLIFFL